MMQRQYSGNACISTESRSKACVSISPNPSVKPTCMVRPLKVVVLLLSVHSLPDQCLLHQLPTHMTDLLTYLPQAPAGDCSYQRVVRGVPLCWFPWKLMSPPDINSLITGNIPFPLA